MVDKGMGLTPDRNLYYLSKFVSQIAQNLLLAALFVIAGTSSHAAIGLSSLFVATLLPAILFGVIGGVIGDRIGAPRGFMFGSALRLAVVFGACVFTSGANTAWAVAFLYSMVSQLSSPAEMALIRIIRRGSSAPAHSLVVATQYGGQGIGMLALAPALYMLGGAHAILIGSAVGFFVLTVLTATLSVRLRATDSLRTKTAREAFSLRQTFNFFHRTPLARDAVTVLAVKSIVSQGIVVALPLYMKHDLNLGSRATAGLLAPGIAGAAIGLIWSSRTVTRERAASVMRLSLIGMTVGVFALAALDFGVTAVADYSHVAPIVYLGESMNTTYIVAFPVAFLIGLSLSGSLVSARVALTETAPVQQQSRVYAVQSTLTDAIVVLPLLLLGVGAQFAGARATLASLGVLATLALLAIEHPRFKAREFGLADAPLAPAIVPVLVEAD